MSKEHKADRSQPRMFVVSFFFIVCFVGLTGHWEKHALRLGGLLGARESAGQIQSENINFKISFQTTKSGICKKAITTLK